MKKILLIIIIFQLISLKTFAQQWVEQQSTTNLDLKSVCFTDINHGWAVGGNNGTGIVIKTFEGHFWHAQYTCSNPLNSVVFLDSLNGFAVGEDGLIMKTADGGEVWLEVLTAQSERWPQHLINQPINLKSIVFVDSARAFICGSYSDQHLIMRSSDAGQTWIEVYRKTSNSGELNKVSFSAPLLGWCAGMRDSILKTTDGGLSWKSYPIMPANEVKTVFFKDYFTGWYTGSGSMIFYTSNSGTNWGIQYSGPPSQLNDLLFVNNLGYAVGGTPVKVLKSTNGGFLWLEEKMPVQDGILNSVFFVDSSNVYSVGNSGRIYRSALPKPNPPVVLKPAIYEKVKTCSPYVSWTPVRLAMSYKLILSGDINFDNVLLDTMVTGENLTIPAKILDINTKYYFKIKTVTYYGESDWSLLCSFTTPEARISGISQIHYEEPFKRAFSNDILLHYEYFYDTTNKKVKYLNAGIMKKDRSSGIWLAQNLCLSPFQNRRDLSFYSNISDMGYSDGDTMNSFVVVYRISDNILTNNSFMNDSTSVIINVNKSRSQLSSSMPLALNHFMDSLTSLNSSRTVNWNANDTSNVVVRGCTVPNIDLNGSQSRIADNPNVSSSAYAGDNNSCVAASHANSMEWLESKHNQIKSGLSFNDKLIELSNLMGRTSANGVTEANEITGILKYIDKYKLPIKVKFQSWSVRDSSIKSPDSPDHSAENKSSTNQALRKIDPQWILDEMKKGEDVTITWGYYNSSKDSLIETHKMVLSEIEKTGTSWRFKIKDDSLQKQAGGTRELGFEVKLFSGYLWVVGMKNAAGNDCFICSAISESYDSSVHFTPPVPEHKSPANGDSSQSKKVELTVDHPWSAYVNIRWQISADSNFSSVKMDTNTSALKLIASSLTSGTTYWWRTKAITKYDSSTWTNPWIFRTKINKIITVSPIDTMKNLGKTVKLVWKKMDSPTNLNKHSEDIPLDNKASYNVLVSKDSLFTNVVRDLKKIADTSISVDALDYQNKYFWKVMGEIGSYISEWSDINNFTTMTIPTLVSELDNNLSLGFEISPNPADESINISLKNKLSGYYTIEILDIDANIIKSIQLSTEMTKISVKELLSGTYFVNIKSETAILQRKIIIVH